MQCVVCSVQCVVCSVQCVVCSVCTLRVVGQGEQADAGGPGPRAEHGDPVGVSSEGGDVLLDPAQGLDLVQQPVVPLGRLVTRAQEACV